MGGLGEMRRIVIGPCFFFAVPIEHYGPMGTSPLF